MSRLSRFWQLFRIVCQCADGTKDQASACSTLLTNLVLPQMSGRALFDRVAALLPRIAVLFMSGYTPGVVLQHRVLEDGMAFLQKPMTPEGLTQRVREVLDVAASKQTG